MKNQFKKEFIDLINNKYEEKYITYLKEIDNKKLGKKMIELLEEKDLAKRLVKWGDFEVKLSEIKDLKSLSNPFYIGFGNPCSDILFLGKEKAIDLTNSPNLFFHESINNNKQWEDIIEDNSCNDLVFNPLFPQLYHSKKNHHKIKARDTWGMYCEVVKGIKTNNPEIRSNTEKWEDNFFNHCFTTEVNHIPSKYSSHFKSTLNRTELLQHAFYKSFKYVIIGAIGSIDPAQIKNIFDIDTEGKEIKVSEEFGKRKRVITVFKTDSQKIILCNQLSGAAGWTTNAIKNLIAEIKSNN